MQCLRVAQRKSALQKRASSKRALIIRIIKPKSFGDASVIKLSEIIETIRSIGYNAYPYDPKSGEERSIARCREYYTKLLVGIFATMNVMWIAVAQYAGYFSGMEKYHKKYFEFCGVRFSQSDCTRHNGIGLF